VDLTGQASAVHVRGKDLDLDVESHLRLQTREGEPRLTGGVHIRRGFLNVSGQRLDFERGDLAFNGSAEPNPTLDIRLTRQFSEARVVIEIRGTLKKPELHLSSDPPIYQDAQIISLLLTGSPGGQPSNGRPFDPTAVAATLVLGKLADAVAPQIGLDVVRVANVTPATPTGTPPPTTGGPNAPLADTRVEVGKYVSDRVYLSYAHVFGATENSNVNEAHIEYRVTRRWIIQTVFGDAGVGSVDALWTYRY
jgi:translocation and assembly module TamB